MQIQIIGKNKHPKSKVETKLKKNGIFFIEILV